MTYSSDKRIWPVTDSSLQPLSVENEAAFFFNARDDLSLIYTVHRDTFGDKLAHAIRALHQSLRSFKGYITAPLLITRFIYTTGFSPQIMTFVMKQPGGDDIYSPFSPDLVTGSGGAVDRLIKWFALDSCSARLLKAGLEGWYDRGCPLRTDDTLREEDEIFDDRLDLFFEVCTKTEWTGDFVPDHLVERGSALATSFFLGPVQWNRRSIDDLCNKHRISRGKAFKKFVCADIQRELIFLLVLEGLVRTYLEAKGYPLTSMKPMQLINTMIVRKFPRMIVEHPIELGLIPDNTRFAEDPDVLIWWNDEILGTAREPEASVNMCMTYDYPRGPPSDASFILSSLQDFMKEGWHDPAKWSMGMDRMMVRPVCKFILLYRWALRTSQEIIWPDGCKFPVASDIHLEMQRLAALSKRERGFYLCESEFSSCDLPECWYPDDPTTHVFLAGGWADPCHITVLVSVCGVEKFYRENITRMLMFHQALDKGRFRPRSTEPPQCVKRFFNIFKRLSIKQAFDISLMYVDVMIREFFDSR